MTGRETEVTALRVDGADLSPFYSQLKTIKDQHRRLPPNAPAIDSVNVEHVLERARVTAHNLPAVFTGEERNGRFLDLYRFYDDFVNLLAPAEAARCDYLHYLDTFERPGQAVAEARRHTAAYAAYLTNLLAYLEDFVRRTRPLTGLVTPTATARLVELETTFAAEREALLQQETGSGLFCKACERAFTNQAVFDGHLSGKKHLKAAAVWAETSATRKDASSEQDALASAAQERLREERLAELHKTQSLVRKETLLEMIGEMLLDVRRATRGNVERRQALTAEERLLADEDSDDGFEDGGEDGHDADEANDTPAEDRIYNPLKLPLDWDGKPIPFWLWKLHGLGVPFPCEICGNYVYMGRRAFDQHFYEWRHAHGMKCLGIPNTRHFFQVTQIEEVRRLWERMRVTARSEAFRPELMEECEDAVGNVYERRTFEDLKRQGLI